MSEGISNNDDMFAGLDLALDEAAVARIAHADYLNAVKQWGMRMGEIMQPFGQIASIIRNSNADDDAIERAVNMFPVGLRLAMKHLDVFYDMMQTEAVNVLGGPFVIHQSHAPQCDNTKGTCPHQDHWRK
jgi:hypothetical protein